MERKNNNTSLWGCELFIIMILPQGYIISQPSVLIDCIEIDIKFNKIWHGSLEVLINLPAIKDQAEIQ